MLQLAAAFPDTLLAMYHVTRGTRTPGGDQDNEAEGTTPCDDVKDASQSEVLHHKRIDRESLATALSFASATPEDTVPVSNAETIDQNGSSDANDAGSILPPLVFLCGPPAFSEALEQVLTSDLGVRPEDLRMEKWW